jgi:hypothetical protein
MGRVNYFKNQPLSYGSRHYVQQSAKHCPLLMLYETSLGKKGKDGIYSSSSSSEAFCCRR